MVLESVVLVAVLNQVKSEHARISRHHLAIVATSKYAVVMKLAHSPGELLE